MFDWLKHSWELITGEEGAPKAAASGDTGRWTAAFLNKKRALGDSKGDAAIAAIVAIPNGRLKLRGVLNGLVENEDFKPEKFDADVRQILVDYFGETAALPTWIDRPAIRLGEQVYEENGPEIGMILACASLPVCYALARDVQTLYFSTQLTGFVPRRIIETTRFLLDVMTRGAMDAGGKGIVCAQKIRLLHATMRYMMLNLHSWRPGLEWKIEQWNTPLNQESLAFTLMSFSIVVIEALEKLGYDLTDKEKDGYFHAWRVVGHLLGIDEDINPTDRADGKALVNAVGKKEWGVSKAGQTVTAALVDFVQHVIPGNVFDGYVPAKIRFLLGDELANMLSVAKPDWAADVLGPLKVFTKIEQEVPLFKTVASTFSRELARGMQTVSLGDTRPLFHVPDQLADKWDVRAGPRLHGALAKEREEALAAAAEK